MWLRWRKCRPFQTMFLSSRCLFSLFLLFVNIFVRKYKYIYLSWVSDQTRQQCAIDGLILRRISKGPERTREKILLLPVFCLHHSLRVWNLEWPHTTYPRGHSKLPHLFEKCGVLNSGHFRLESAEPFLVTGTIYTSVSIFIYTDVPMFVRLVALPTVSKVSKTIWI